MHPQPAVGGDEDRQIFQKLLGYYDAPAFVRRVKRLEDSERILTEHLTKKRADYLTMVRLRVGQLRALAGDWIALRPLLAAEESLDGLRSLHEALQPELRLPLAASHSHRILRGALDELTDALGIFNRRWQKYVTEFDLIPLNELRDGYNKHYLIEKECALGNSRVARVGFQPRAPLTTAELLRQYPLLPLPQLA